MRILFAAFALSLGGCSGSLTPCTATTCPDISGTYLASITPAIKCTSWAVNTVSLLTLEISEQVGTVTMTVQPDPASPVHTLTGTLNASGTFNVVESVPNPLLNIAYAQIDGSIKNGFGRFTMILLPSMGGASAGDAGSGGDPCRAVYQINAQVQGSPSADAGTTAKADSGT
jgi:hypothetical protein